MPGWGLTVLLPAGDRRPPGPRDELHRQLHVAPTRRSSCGLVNHVVPHDELIPFTRRIAADIVGNEQTAVRQIRQTYAVIAHDDDGWETEARDSRAWRRTMSSPETIADRRAAIQERGRVRSRRLSRDVGAPGAEVGLDRLGDVEGEDLGAGLR